MPVGLNKPPTSPTKGHTAKTFSITKNDTTSAGKRIVIYGASGSGKTTLSLGAPDPVFIDLEGGTVGLNVNLIPGVESFADLRDAVRQSLTLVPERGTLIIDTVTRVDEFIVDHLIKETNKQSIRQLGYDRFPSALEAFRLLLSDFDPLIRSGRNVVLNAHTAVVTFKNATGDDYREEGPSLAHAANASCRNQLNAWADHVFRLTFEETQVGDIALVGEKGKEKRVGKIQNASSNRVIYTSGTASLIAKSRPIAGRHLPPIVAFSGPEDMSLWTMLCNPETIPE